MRRTGFNRTGFTIIELVVVFGVVLVLIALMYGVASGMLRSARSAQCISNLRTCGVALRLFIIDSDNVLRVRTGGYPTGDLFWGQALWRRAYIDDREVLRCPVAPGGPPFRDTSAWEWFTYGLNVYDPRGENVWVETSGGGRGLVWQLRLSRIDDPASFLLLGDSYSPQHNYQFARLGGALPGYLHLKHNSHANVLFLDGHVESVDRQRAEDLGVRHIYEAQPK